MTQPVRRPRPSHRFGLAAAAVSVSPIRLMRSLAPPLVRTASSEDMAKATSSSTGMARAMNLTGTPVYVRPPVSEVAKRRKKGKAQRQARAAHRRAARR